MQLTFLYLSFTGRIVFLTTECCMSLSKGQHSYREHGNRMLLIWLHGAELADMSLAKELYQALVNTGNSKAAGI